MPDSWSLADAATVPVVYATAYYALVMRGRIRKGESILIHGGSGGVGQAAIAIALQYGLTVYTTVGSKDKREYLMKRFPQLTEKNFANSRSTDFEQHVRHATRGQGVNLVLNSLANEMLQASLKLNIKHLSSTLLGFCSLPCPAWSLLGDRKSRFVSKLKPRHGRFLEERHLPRHSS